MVKIVLGKKKPEQQNQASPNEGGLFGTKKEVPQNNNSDVKEDVKSMGRRLKVAEERYSNLRNKFQVTEQNMIHKHKNFFTDIKTINLELTELKKEITELKDNMVSVVREMESFAKNEKVDILKKYIDLWNPIKFVTKNEVEEIVKEVIDRMRREN
jgi:predicted  nucleic acid-binding Zn-ribbon protein